MSLPVCLGYHVIRVLLHGLSGGGKRRIGGRGRFWTGGWWKLVLGIEGIQPFELLIQHGQRLKPAMISGVSNPLLGIKMSSETCLRSRKL